ncbi:MAG: hypothetical protein QXW57_04690 [Candidatus Micrarchaeaceae archaeon]
MALIAVSLTYLPMAYQDFKDRMVSDVYLALPYVSFIVTIYTMYALPYLAMSAVLGVAAAILYKRGLLAIGDVAAAPLIFSSGIWYVIVAIVLVFGFHMAWFISKNGIKFNRQVNADTAKKDAKWIPGEPNDKGLVNETYGVPLAGYIALGNMIGIIAYSIL